MQVFPYLFVEYELHILCAFASIGSVDFDHCFSFHLSKWWFSCIRAAKNKQRKIYTNCVRRLAFGALWILNGMVCRELKLHAVVLRSNGAGVSCCTHGDTMTKFIHAQRTRSMQIVESEPHKETLTSEQHLLSPHINRIIENEADVTSFKHHTTFYSAWSRSLSQCIDVDKFCTHKKMLFIVVGCWAKRALNGSQSESR